MNYLTEYREPRSVQTLLQALTERVTSPWTIMEICGGQTHSLLKYGIDQLLPPSITLIHGPGCPVCVTPAAILDRAIALATRPEVILCSFGDMLRVPGSQTDLLSTKARGGQVRIVHSPLDAVHLAQSDPTQQVVFFAVGFETTVPATALVINLAHRLGISNFSVLVGHVRVPPVMEAILSSPDRSIQGFLAAGHVCTVMGMGEYQSIARCFSVPIVVTGFEPLDLVWGLYACVDQLQSGRAEVENRYGRSVRPQGNVEAQRLMQEVFQIVATEWRGIGRIPNSGFALRGTYRDFDACQRFGVVPDRERETVHHPCGQILMGHLKPPDCHQFGRNCTPDQPLGAPMVSSEGACAAYFRYRQCQASIPV